MSVQYATVYKTCVDQSRYMVDHALAQTQWNFFDWQPKKKRPIHTHRREEDDDDDDDSDDSEEEEDHHHHGPSSRMQKKLTSNDSVTCCCWEDTAEFFDTLQPEKWYEGCKLNDAEVHAQIAIDTALVNRVRQSILRDKYYDESVTPILETISPQPNALAKGGGSRSHDIHFERALRLTDEQQFCLGTFYGYLIDLITIVFIRIGALERIQTQAPNAFEKTTQMFSYLMGLRVLIIRQQHQLPLLRKVDTSIDFLLKHILPRDDGLLASMASKHASMQELYNKLKQTDIEKAKVQNQRDTLMASIQIIQSELSQAQRTRKQMQDIPFRLAFYEKTYDEMAQEQSGHVNSGPMLSRVAPLTTTANKHH